MQVPRRQTEGAHRDHPNDRYHFLSAGVLHGFDPGDDDQPWAPGKPSQGSLIPEGSAGELQCHRDAGWNAFLNKEATTLEQLGQQVRTSVEKEPELVLIINADDQALHGAIVSVMDEVRLAGVSVWPSQSA